MTASSQFLYYTSRIIHLLLLPIMYIGILWFPEEKRWTVTGLLILFVIPTLWFFGKENKYILFFKCILYLVTIVIFIPTEPFKYIFDYKNVILFDMCFLATVDISIYFERRKINKIKDRLI